MGVPRAFRTHNGAECTNSTFVGYCNGLGTLRELTVPYTPQQNGSVESGFSRAIKAGHAARLEVDKFFQTYTSRNSSEFEIRTTQVCGWSLFCGHPKGSAVLRRRQTAACFPRTKYFSGAARLCRSSCSASRRTVVSHGGVKLAPRRARVFPEFGVQSCKRLPQDYERRDRKGRALARRHMAPVGGTAHFPGPDSRTGRALFIIRC